MIATRVFYECVLYNLLKLLHILLAITAVGSNLSYGIWQGLAGNDPQRNSFVLRGIKFVDDHVAKLLRAHISTDHGGAVIDLNRVRDREETAVRCLEPDGLIIEPQSQEIAISALCEEIEGMRCVNEPG